MATEYISRDSILKWIDDSLEQCGRRYTAEQENMMEMFRTVVNDCLPFADVVEQKHGKWNPVHIVDEHGNEHPFDGFQCSNCGNIGKKWMQYCFNCGARMVTDDV